MTLPGRAPKPSVPLQLCQLKVFTFHGLHWLSSQGWISLLHMMMILVYHSLHIPLLLAATTLAISVLCLRYPYGSLLLENEKISQPVYTYFPLLLISLPGRSGTSYYCHWGAEEGRPSEQWFVHDVWWSKKKLSMHLPEMLVGSQTRWPCLNQTELNSIKALCSIQYNFIYALK